MRTASARSSRQARSSDGHVCTRSLLWGSIGEEIAFLGVVWAAFSASDWAVHSMLDYFWHGGSPTKGRFCIFSTAPWGESMYTRHCLSHQIEQEKHPDRLNDSSRHAQFPSSHTSTIDRGNIQRP
jgi:hypothetical protein